MNLLGKLFIRVMLLIFITGIVIGKISFEQASTSMNELMMINVDQQLESKSELINEKLQSTKRIVKIISSGESVINDLRTGSKTSSTSRVLTTILDGNSDLISLITLIDSNGIILNTDDHNTNVVGADVSERFYLMEAIEKGEAVISDVIISEATGNAVIAVAIPVINNGKSIGAIVATIDFSLFADAITGTEIGGSGYAYLLDASGDNAGTFLAHRDMAKVDDTKNVYDYNIDELSSLIDEFEKNETGSAYYTFEGVSKFTKYKKVSGWAIMITMNEKDLDYTSAEIRYTTIIVLLLSVVVASIMNYFTVKAMIIKPLNKLEFSMEAAGKGDLTNTVDIRTKDELERLGNAFNEMVENQRATITGIDEISNDLSSSAEELTASASEVNDSAEEVSKNIEDMMNNTHMTTSQLNEVKEEVNILNTSIDSSHTLSSQSNASCKIAVEYANDGRKSLTESIKSIENISESTDKIIGNFTELNTHAKEVTGISETINGIASQINLLALNASIEAARAGEAGRGFTVVAEEVRKLAEQTTSESQSISGVLTTITSLIKDADECVNITKKQVDIGETSIKSLDEKLLEIVETFKVLDSDIVELDQIASRQVQISDKIIEYVNNVSKNAKSNAEMAESISAAAEEQSAITESLSGASEETSNMADDLNKMIEKFTI